jgi:hypothetical protein
MGILKQKNKRDRSILIGGFFVFLASGIPWWITDYATYSLSSVYTYFSIGFCLLGSLILALFTDLKFIEKIGTALVSHMIAFFVKLIQDTLEDKTNHNLFPFEMAFYLFIDGVGSGVLVMIGTFIRKQIRK